MRTAFEALNQWADHIQSYRLPIAKAVLSKINSHGKGAELGCGTAWFSAIDVDAERISLAKKFFIPRFQGDLSKISFYQHDYHSLSFENDYLDFIVADAALHHTENLPKLLGEANRVLKKDGPLMAIREPVLPSFFILKTLKKFLFGRRQKRRGDIEMIYDKQRWQGMFTAAGFTVRFYPYCLKTSRKERLVAWLKYFNGVFFNRTYILARKKALFMP